MLTQVTSSRQRNRYTTSSQTDRRNRERALGPCPQNVTYNHLGTAYRSRGNNLPSQHTTHRTTIPTFSPNAYLSRSTVPHQQTQVMYSQTTPTISNRRKASGSRYHGHITPLSFLSYLLTFNNLRLWVYVLCMYVVLGTCSYAPPPKRKSIPAPQHRTPTFSQPLLPLLRCDSLPAQASKCCSAQEPTPYIDASLDLIGCRPPGGWEQDVCVGCEGLCVRKVP